MCLMLLLIKNAKAKYLDKFANPERGSNNYRVVKLKREICVSSILETEKNQILLWPVYIDLNWDMLLKISKQHLQWQSISEFNLQYGLNCPAVYWINFLLLWLYIRRVIQLANVFDECFFIHSQQ